MYSGIDRQAEWILTRALDEAAAATPDRIWVLSTEGGQLTFGEAAEQTRRSAGFFARLGVRSGDRIEADTAWTYGAPSPGSMRYWPGRLVRMTNI